MADHAPGGAYQLPKVVPRHRLARMIAMSLALAGLVVALQFGSAVAFYGLLVAGLLGGAIGIKSRYRDGYVFYGNLIVASILGPLLAWVVAGVFPTLYVDVHLFSAMVGIAVRTGASVTPVLLSFYAGLFGGVFVRSAVRRTSLSSGVVIGLVGFVVYTGAHLLLAELRPDLGGRSVQLLGGQGGLARLYEFLQLTGGLVTFVGTAAVAERVEYDRVLLAGVVVATALAGAGLGTTHAEFTTALTAQEVSGAVETDVTDVRMADDELRFGATIQNPTDTRVIVSAGYVELYRSGDRIANGPVVVENSGGSVVVPPRGSATVEFSMRLSPDQAAATRDALDAGELRLSGRLSSRIADQSTGIPFEATVE